MRRTEALKIITRALKQPVEDVPAADLIYGRSLAHIESPSPETPQPWAIQVDVLALRIAAQLPLSDDTEQQSPLAQAEDAKRRRNIDDEIAALTGAHDQLTSAPWYPARPGDLVHIHYEQAGDLPPFGETYIVGDAGDNMMSLQLLAHTLPETVPGMDAEATAEMAGIFAVEILDCPLYQAWFEAGPQRLTIVRDGRPVHIGGAG
ncbi:hypothetical protein [Streptomyces pseudovenezuelae]|uniref:hypothetical protein n=1 Tax=Streptomyces pseudovenezuelae TaxID=67350 RepID=UPI0036EBA09F